MILAASLFALACTLVALIPISQAGSITITEDGQPGAVFPATDCPNILELIAECRGSWTGVASPSGKFTVSGGLGVFNNGGFSHTVFLGSSVTNVSGGPGTIRVDVTQVYEMVVPEPPNFGDMASLRGTPCPAIAGSSITTTINLNGAQSPVVGGVCDVGFADAVGVFTAYRNPSVLDIEVIFTFADGSAPGSKLAAQLIATDVPEPPTSVLVGLPVFLYGICRNLRRRFSGGIRFGNQPS